MLKSYLKGIYETAARGDARDWKVELAQKDLKESGPDKEKIVPILYRPFDVRYTYYTGKSRGFHCMPRPEVMRHMMRENLGLLSCRQLSKIPWQHALMTATITDDCYISNRTKERSYLFPLYTDAHFLKKDLYSNNEKARKIPNIDERIFSALLAVYGSRPTPEEVLYYIYAILYSNTYRVKYVEFLKTDFPRVPFTKNRETFLALGTLGKRLADLHLLKSPGLDAPAARFQGIGENCVEGVKYDEGGKRVHINRTQYFEGIEKGVWAYQIGGYQVLRKWLKDRKGRILGLAAVRRYCRVATALKETMVLQEAIDRAYPAAEGDLLEINLG